MDLYPPTEATVTRGMGRRVGGGHLREPSGGVEGGHRSAGTPRKGRSAEVSGGLATSGQWVAGGRDGGRRHLHPGTGGGRVGCLRDTPSGTAGLAAGVHRASVGSDRVGGRVGTLVGAAAVRERRLRARGPRRVSSRSDGSHWGMLSPPRAQRPGVLGSAQRELARARILPLWCPLAVRGVGGFVEKRKR